MDTKRCHSLHWHFAGLSPLQRVGIARDWVAEPSDLPWCTTVFYSMYGEREAEY